MTSLLRVGALSPAAVFAAGVVGYVAMLRPDIPYDRLEAKYASADSRFIDTPGGLHMRYRDQGDPNRPAMVMVHGFSAPLPTWEPRVARLGHDSRIVTLDLPGHEPARRPAIDPAPPPTPTLSTSWPCD